MSLPRQVEEALQDLKLARARVAAAKLILEAMIPEGVMKEIHYNGQHAQIPLEYVPVQKALRSEGAP